ncbi:hypothetical protein, partial [Bradyrhizobium ottawaense]|uniref:hypothetical protein n=1 Tax=Bradyrhizobium ottawaense TaxID=931866 RepID=UPI0030C7231D
MYKIREIDEMIGLLAPQVYDKYKKSVDAEPFDLAQIRPLGAVRGYHGHSCRQFAMAQDGVGTDPD